MFEIQYRTLMATTARPVSIQAARTAIVKLETLKARIQRLPQSLPEIDQVNSLRKRIGIIEKQIKKMEEEREFGKRDQVRDEREKKDDKFKVKPVVDEIEARKSYRK